MSPRLDGPWARPIDPAGYRTLSPASQDRVARAREAAAIRAGQVWGPRRSRPDRFATVTGGRGGAR